MRDLDPVALDRHITGNYGEDQYPEEEEAAQRRDHLDELLTHRIVALDEIQNHGKALANLALVQRAVRSFDMDDAEVEEWIEALES